MPAVSGWTIVAPSPDGHSAYVSSTTGDDRNDGRHPDRAKRTIAAGVELLRHGFPDRLLLRLGDAWKESLGHWRKSGRARHAPMLISSYGDSYERPTLLTGAGGGIWTDGGGGSSASIDHVAIVGLHFWADEYRGGGDCAGGKFLAPGENLLIEDCKFEGYSTNVVFQGKLHDVRLRRSVVVDAHVVHGGIGEHPQGLYAYGVDGLLIEDCVFDHNGWSENVAGAGADVFSHNIYIDNGNKAVVVRGNLIADGSSHGLQLRCGGEVVNNLFVRNAISLLVGGGSEPERNGVLADVRRNVILDGKDISPELPRGWGMVFGNIAAGRAARNVIGRSCGRQPYAIVLDAGSGIGVRDLELEENVLGGALEVQGDPEKLVNFRHFSSRILGDSHPERSLATYQESMGRAATHEAFMAEARQQSRLTWREEYTADAVNRYLRQGFAA